MIQTHRNPGRSWSLKRLKAHRSTFFYSSKQGMSERMCTSKTLNAFLKCFKRMKHMQKQTWKTIHTSNIISVQNHTPIFRTYWMHRHESKGYSSSLPWQHWLCDPLCELWDRFSGAELCLLIWPQLFCLGLSPWCLLLHLQFHSICVCLCECVCVCVFVWVG